MKSKLKNIFLIVCGAVLLISSVFYIIESVSLGAQIAKLEKEEYELLEINREMSDIVVNQSSLSSFEKKKEELGFMKPSQIVYLKGEVGVAKLP